MAMNDREATRYGMHRLRAAAHRVSAAGEDLSAAAVKTGAAFRCLAEAFQGCVDNDLAAHPDMAELNVRLDALYDRP